MISPGQASPPHFPRAPSERADNARAPNHLLVENLRRSEIFREYQRAFETATGLPLSLQAPGALCLAHRDSKFENPFCALMGQDNKSCSACLEAQRHVRERTVSQAGTLTCYAGLCESSG